MRSTMLLSGAFTAFFLIASVFSKACPPLGPVLLPPQSPGSSKAVTQATKQLKSTFDSITSDYKTSGLAIIVKSIHEDEQLFSYYFTPPIYSGIGTKSIGKDTIFRVGSVSKIFTALAILQNSSISMDDSILKYIPALQNARATKAVDAIPWKEVTIGSLMSHLSGIGRDSKY